MGIASPFFLIVLFSYHAPPFVQAAPPPRGYYIDCGSVTEKNIDGIPWIPDEGFIDVGNVSHINTPGIVPLLSTLRYFPDAKTRKNCFVIQVSKGSKYIVRTTYYYGGFDGGKEPPLFDQIIDGTRWSAVDTSRNYAAGLASYYEIMVAAQGKTLSVCLARNENTATSSSPFISALEVVSLEDSMYNSTNFLEFGLNTIARHSFGEEGGIIRNLTNFGISGVLSDSIGNLSAINNIWLSGNKLSGIIPHMGNLKELTSLRLADNEFADSIPSFLAELPKIREIFLQGNNLSGPVPESLKNNTVIDLKISPGNKLEM